MKSLKLLYCNEIWHPCEDRKICKKLMTFFGKHVDHLTENRLVCAVKKNWLILTYCCKMLQCGIIYNIVNRTI